MFRLAQERGDEGRRRVGRGLLFVFAVVAGGLLAPVPPVGEACEGERGPDRECKQDEEPAADVVDGVVDALLIPLDLPGVGGLLGDDAVEGAPGLDPGAGGGRQELAGEDNAQLDELAGRDVERAQQGGPRRARDVASDPLRVTPDPVAAPARLAGQRQRRPQLREPDLPLVAPDLQVDVDDVVVGDGEPAEPVADRERALLGRGAVVPDDAEPAVRIGGPERVRVARAAELGRRSLAVAATGLGDVDVVDRLPVAQRDLAKRARERAVEGERDPLGDPERAVLGDLDVDRGLGQRERLGGGLGSGDGRERRKRGGGRREPAGQNETRGASRAAGCSSSKYCRGRKPNSWATMFVGTDSIAVSYVSTVSL